MSNTCGKDDPSDNIEEGQEESDGTEDDTLLIDSIAKEACERENLGGSQALLVVDNNKLNVDEIQVEKKFPGAATVSKDISTLHISHLENKNNEQVEELEGDEHEKEGGKN